MSRRQATRRPVIPTQEQVDVPSSSATVPPPGTRITSPTPSRQVSPKSIIVNSTNTPPPTPETYSNYGQWDALIAAEAVQGNKDPVGLVRRLADLVDLPGLNDRTKLYYAIAYVDLSSDTGIGAPSIFSQYKHFTAYDEYVHLYNENFGVKEKNEGWYVIRFFRDALLERFADARSLYDSRPDLSYMDAYPGLLVPVVKRYVLNNSSSDISRVIDLRPAAVITILRHYLNYRDIAQAALGSRRFISALIRFLVTPLPAGATTRNRGLFGSSYLVGYPGLLLLNEIVKMYYDREATLPEEERSEILLQYEQAEVLTERIAGLGPSQATNLVTLVRWLTIPLWMLSTNAEGQVIQRTTLIPMEPAYYDVRGNEVEFQRRYIIEGTDTIYVQRFDVELFNAFANIRYPNRIYPDTFDGEEIEYFDSDESDFE